MRVRFLTDWFHGGVRVHAAGETKDLDEASALRFLRRGVAEDAGEVPEASAGAEASAEVEPTKPKKPARRPKKPPTP